MNILFTVFCYSVPGILSYGYKYCHIHANHSPVKAASWLWSDIGMVSWASHLWLHGVANTVQGSHIFLLRNSLPSLTQGPARDQVLLRAQGPFSPYPPKVSGLKWAAASILLHLSSAPQLTCHLSIIPLLWHFSHAPIGKDLLKVLSDGTHLALQFSEEDMSISKMPSLAREEKPFLKGGGDGGKSQKVTCLL